MDDVWDAVALERLRQRAIDPSMKAFVWLRLAEPFREKVDDPETSSDTRAYAEAWLDRNRPVIEAAEKVRDAFDLGSYQRAVELGNVMEDEIEALEEGKRVGARGSYLESRLDRPSLTNSLSESTERDEASDPGSWALLPADEAAAHTYELVARFFEALRRRDYEAMMEMADPHLGALMGGLVQCAAAVVGVFRETLDNDTVYLEMMDQFSQSEDGSVDDIRSIAVHMVNSQGGVDVPGRWTGPATVQMTPDMVREVNFAIAAILNALIEVTASATGRQPDEAFRYFLDLVRRHAV